MYHIVSFPVDQPRDSHRVQRGNRLGQPSLARIQRVVVGQRDNVEAGRSQGGGRLWRCSQVVAVTHLRRSRQRRFQVGEGQLSPIQPGLHLSEGGLPIPIQRLRHAAAQHHVADEGQRKSRPFGFPSATLRAGAQDKQRGLPW